jgi:hypothetical protein
MGWLISMKLFDGLFLKGRAPVARSGGAGLWGNAILCALAI